MDFDSLLPEIGAFGRYQKILIGVVLIPTVFPCAFQAYSQLFIAATPDHFCRIPELDDWFAKFPDQVRAISIPSIALSNGKLKFDRCQMFDRNYTEINENFEESINDRGFNRSLVNCRHGWHFDKALYSSTVVSKVSLINVSTRKCGI